VLANESKKENPDEDCVDGGWAGFWAYSVSNSRRMSKDIIV